jgi:CRP-like cAMP-binding protein
VGRSAHAVPSGIWMLPRERSRARAIRCSSRRGSGHVTREGQHVAGLGPGDFLGEIAALERGKRTASVTAKSSMSLLVMNARDLRVLASSIPDLGHKVQEKACERHPLAQAA